MLFRTMLLTLTMASAITVAAEPVTVTSPDGKLTLTFTLHDGAAVYHVSQGDRVIIADSAMDLTLKDGTHLGRDLKLVNVTTSKHDDTWQPVYGERSTIVNRYNQTVIELQRTAAPPLAMNVIVRAYDEGVAFRYEIPQQPAAAEVVIASENTAFTFTADHSAWAVYSAQGKYEHVTVSRIKDGCERPLVVRIGDDCYAAIAEAELVNYARMKLGPRKQAPLSLVSQLASAVKSPLPVATPWRVVMVADSPGKLLENNDLILNLNAPCAIADTSWIKPGKVLREVTLTTDGARRCVDFAQRHKLQYVLFDAGWYGHEYDDASDAATVTLDPKRSKGPLDLQGIIDYAKERGVGVILYVNRRALEKQIDEILPLYRKWGVAGVKYGFVNVGSQQWTTWLHDAVRKAADHRLMVDIHDEYRPTGYSRTYPNLMTQEGIGGDETSPTSDQTLTLLFSRFLAGAADNTICYFNPRVVTNANHAFQLAKAVCLYSPWQFLYWYDRPAPGSGAGEGMNGVIGDEPELEFFSNVPTMWDESRVLDGAIGEHAIMARRSGDAWFIGALNAGDAYAFDIKLDMLKPNVQYTANIYSHDPKSKTRTQVGIETRQVTSADTIAVQLATNDGLAVHIFASSGAGAAVETDKRLHSDGKGWRLQQAVRVDPKRPRVLLIGDSILNGYLDRVTKRLDDAAYVDAWVNPYSQASYKLDQMIAEVLDHGPYDVIHFNMGLHGWQKGRIPDGQFIPLTEKLAATMREHAPKAKLIWAASTPVTVKDRPEQINPEIDPIIVEHNRMAAEVMGKHDIPVNDLHGLLTGHLNLARGDMFHWNGPGYEMMADVIAASIKNALATK
jgi:alpha-glucosidase